MPVERRQGKWLRTTRAWGTWLTSQLCTYGQGPSAPHLTCSLSLVAKGKQPRFLCSTLRAEHKSQHTRGSAKSQLQECRLQWPVPPPTTMRPGAMKSGTLTLSPVNGLSQSTHCPLTAHVRLHRQKLKKKKEGDYYLHQSYPVWMHANLQRAITVLAGLQFFTTGSFRFYY